MPGYKYIFSVIVPTYNRSDEIYELLLSLSCQTLPLQMFEVVIVDDGSTDNTEDIITGVKKIGRLNLKFLKQDHKGPGEARNLGMKNAEGNYFIFIDSDCIADEFWLEAYSNAIEDLMPAAFGGPDQVLPDFLPVQKAIDYSMTSFLTTGGIRGHSDKKISKYYPRSFNMGVRADIVDKIGGMGKLRHGQDIEFSNRIINTGEPVIKVPGAVVFHKRRISVVRFFKQVFNWGVARINLFKIDKQMLEAVHFLPAAGTILSLLILLLALVLPETFLPVVYFGLVILILMAVHGAIKYRDYKVFFYIPLIVPTQILGYGTGFIYAFIKRIVLKKDVITGFVKKYYK